MGNLAFVGCLGCHVQYVIFLPICQGLFFSGCYLYFIQEMYTKDFKKEIFSRKKHAIFSVLNLFTFCL